MRNGLSEYLINVALVFVSTDPFALPVWRLGVETTTARYTWLARKTRHSRTGDNSIFSGVSSVFYYLNPVHCR
jgi:hypothetical protein